MFVLVKGYVRPGCGERVQGKAKVSFRDSGGGREPLKIGLHTKREYRNVKRQDMLTNLMSIHKMAGESLRHRFVS